MDKKNLGESICQRLKDLSKERKRPFDEILRYYAMERFLFRLSTSPYNTKLFLKGGLILKVWDPLDHRATMDIDLLGRISNQIKDLKQVITEIAAIPYEEDAITFDTQHLTIRRTQTAGDYEEIRASFSAKLFKAKLPVLIDIGFNDIIVPKPQQIHYPTLLGMPTLELLGYTLETVIAEKLESIVKLGLINTRMKDFYDLWTIVQREKLNPKTLELAVKNVFMNRASETKYPIAFTPVFYEATDTLKRWDNFLSSIGKNTINFQDVIHEISNHLTPLIKASTNAAD
ncbi:nucleotidyl transferase AbiEii/AbiGii toxin family protein [Candidatus Neptunochlamydia vexilliferae]|uniref:Nucleotidyl transferase AbiEii/AbiGii toxin family protein n=1 Tax=Candidatus Neptunichlamydia vexilliferae TaxID=1651774 RepID=A0ABS0AYE8_9BACT|nr:nucleotidyl transferase AbiEii/AbiGii toxin family protein [Candidatus Neptunochlamydia vexilliferae]MBF5059161.1 hypothetical protein [Candidatus Neptunochlamydia vexilliferae]